MSQRISGFARKERECYETPEWVTWALLPYLRKGLVWEPACGSGKIQGALEGAGFAVIGTDVAGGMDFLTHPPPDHDMIVTNPPYDQATEFIERAIDVSPFTALLLRTDFDHAKTRRHLFADCPQFSKKVVLTKRIVWFDRPKAAPSFNHAWFIWDERHSGPPTLAYGPEAA